jgi:hypothetical protein
MKKLTHANYHTHQNKYLTSSKIGWYLKSPELFYKYFIKGNYEYKKTDAMIIGGALDCIATQSLAKFKKLYTVVDRRNSKAEDYEYQLNQTMYDQVMGMWNSLKKQPAFKELKNYKKQVILSLDCNFGGKYFEGLAGMLDFLLIDKDKAIIVDLKTSNGVNPETYHYKCQEFGYYRQMAMYSSLVSRIYNINSKNIICRHIVVDKDADGINKVYTFEFDIFSIEVASNVLSNTLSEISDTTKFKDPVATWDNVTRL